MPKRSGLRILAASLIGIAAFALNAAADESKPESKAAPGHSAAAPHPGAVPPGYRAPGAPGARPGVPGARPGVPGAAFRGGPGGLHAGPHYEFRGRDFAHFSVDEQRVWGGGSWHHDWHDGRLGWWWYTDGGWYFYDEPVYPMPLVVSDVYVADPNAAVEEPAPVDPGYPPPPPAPTPPVQYWYYCDNPAGYYPYVQTCPTQFRPVPATPPAQYQAAPTGQYPAPGQYQAPAQ